MTSITSAQTMDAKALTELAIQSEAYWGYDDAFMESFKTLYGVSEEFIQENPTFILRDGGDLIGFYSLVSMSPDSASLEFFYIAPAYIGKGWGKVLWLHLAEICIFRGIAALHIVTSPQAKEFYLKMGAVHTGDVDSMVVKGRKIPELLYKVENRS